jgi:uncharacterized protein (TIGR02453 family)
MDAINLEPVLSFLTDLSQHNNKAWYEQNRPAYEAAKVAFERFTNNLIDEFRVVDNLGNLTAKECISRIYRDLRFSKDKTPYQTHMWATIAPGGKKAMRMGYHVSIQPQGQSILAGGLWESTTEQLNRFRQSIDEDPSDFKGIISTKPFLDYYGGIKGDKLKTAPQGYDRAHPDIDLLQLKQVVVVRYFTDQEVLAKDFPDKVVVGCRVMRPFLDYMNLILE